MLELGKPFFNKLIVLLTKLLLIDIFLLPDILRFYDMIKVLHRIHDMTMTFRNEFQFYDVDPL